MPGGDEGGDGTKVAIHMTHDKSTDTCSLFAVALTGANKRREVGAQLRKLTVGKGFLPGHKPSNQEIASFYDQNDPLFTSLASAAAACGFESVGLIWGGGAALIVGSEMLGGVLTDLKGNVCRAISSQAYTFGIQEEIVAFIGVYASTERVEEVGGFEFFWSMGADLGVGMDFRVFTTFSGASGIVVCLTTGEEIELSVGVGYTTATNM